ncbi:MAG: ribonuclease Z [Pirellulaceae bacterium]|nr:ribonuclease Z [Pirellulaceae bacterium]
MHLHFLGTAGYHPNESRHTSCVFIPEVGLMLDAGSGLFRALPLIQHDSLDILLSHAHLDHVLGLTFVLDLLAVTRLKKIRVYGERQKLETVQQHLFAELLFPVRAPIEWIVIEDQPTEMEICGAKVHWFPLEHPGGSVGYRIEWPNLSLAYVTDTTSRPNSAYWPLVKGVDWLVHECNFRDEEQRFAELTGHSWGSAVIQGAAAARISRLILTHLNPLATGHDPLGLSTITASHVNGSPDTLIVAEDQMIIPLDVD